MSKDLTPGRDNGQLIAILSILGALLMVVLGVLWGALNNMPF